MAKKPKFQGPKWKKPTLQKPTLQKPTLTLRSRNGLFSTALICIAIAVVLIFNIAVGQVPEKWRQFDISNTKIYTISDTTLDYLAQLDKDVDITVIASQDETDDRIINFLDRYGALSDHLNLKWIDPVVYPSALTEYDCDANTVVVSCGDRTDTISFDEILVPDLYSQYYYNTTYYTEFDGEGQLTSAIDYVVADSSYQLYCTENHGEAEIGTNLSDLLTKNHFDVNTVSLLMDGIPEDCDALLINSPTSDLSAKEVETLEDYLQQGGRLTLVLGSTDFDHPNLDSLMKTYGLEMAGGYVGDTTRYYQGAQSYFAYFPEIDTASDAATNLNSDDLCLVYNSLGLKTTDPARDTIEVDPFLTTSDNGIVAVSEGEYEQGTYVVGATATEVVDDGEDEEEAAETDGDADEAEEITARFTVFSSPSIIDDGLTSEFSSIVNLNLFMNTLTAGFENVSNLSIESKSLEVTYNTVTNAGLWSLLFLVILPILVLIWGFTRWYRRRKL